MLGCYVIKISDKRLTKCVFTAETLGLFFPKSISEMLGFSFRSLPRGARFERSLRVTGAGAAEMAWEEATEGLEQQKWHGRRLRRGSEV